MICHFSNMTYFILILLHYHFDICLFVSSRALFRDSVMFVTRNKRGPKRGPRRGGYFCGLMALSWDPVVIFT